MGTKYFPEFGRQLKYELIPIFIILDYLTNENIEYLPIFRNLEMREKAH